MRVLYIPREMISDDGKKDTERIKGKPAEEC